MWLGGQRTSGLAAKDPWHQVYESVLSTIDCGLQVETSHDGENPATPLDIRWNQTRETVGIDDSDCETPRAPGSSWLEAIKPIRVTVSQYIRIGTVMCVEKDQIGTGEGNVSIKVPRGVVVIRRSGDEMKK